MKEEKLEKTAVSGIVRISGELKPEHLEELKKAAEETEIDLPVLVIEDLKNGKDFKIITLIHEFLNHNDINITCLISGTNHFSAILLLSCNHIKYRTATDDTNFIFDMDNYIELNFDPNADLILMDDIFEILRIENPYNSEILLGMFDEGDEFCIHVAYKIGLIDNMLFVNKDEITDVKLEEEIIDIIRFRTFLYMDRLENIMDHLTETVFKIY